MNRVMSTVFVSILMAGVGIVAATPAEATERCSVSGNDASRVCWATKSLEKTTHIIEQREIRNAKDSKKSIQAKCDFQESFSRQVGITTSLGYKTSLTVEADIMMVVKASASAEFSVTVGASYSQTASNATSLGGSATLDPGEKLVCTRKNVQISGVVVRTTYGGKITVETFKVDRAPVQKVVVEVKVVNI